MIKGTGESGSATSSRISTSIALSKITCNLPFSSVAISTTLPITAFLIFILDLAKSKNRRTGFVSLGKPNAAGSCYSIRVRRRMSRGYFGISPSSRRSCGFGRFFIGKRGYLQPVFRSPEGFPFASETRTYERISW